MVAQLIEYFYEGDILEAVGRVLRRIEGAYALGILCADFPDQLIAVRKDSPLILGYGDGCNFLASDVTALIKYTREVYYLDDGEIAELTADETELNAEVDKAVAAMESCLLAMKFDQGLAAVMNAVRAGNRYMEKTAPWSLAKTRCSTPRPTRSAGSRCCSRR